MVTHWLVNHPGLTDGLIDSLTCGDLVTGLLIQRLTDRLTTSCGDSLTGLYLLIQGLSDFWLTDWTRTVDSLTTLLIQGLSDWMSLTSMTVVIDSLTSILIQGLSDWLTDWLTNNLCDSLTALLIEGMSNLMTDSLTNMQWHTDWPTDSRVVHV